MKIPSNCAFCGVPSAQLCVGCRNVVYCSKDHQKLHWKREHKAKCKCFEIAEDAVMGRYIRATRDIKQGEIILREPPLIYGPKVASAPLCLGCHRLLPPPTPPQQNYYKCSQCAWPLCGAACEQSALHADECNLMAQRKFKAKIDYNITNAQVRKKESAYCVILPLRCIMLKLKNPKQFEQFSNLQDHLAERMNTPLYNILGANLITFVRTVLGMQDWLEKDIMRIAATLDTNAFEVRQTAHARRLRAIYPAAAMISHDCISNARHTFDDQMQIVFIAKTSISKGSIIATSYTQPLKSTPLRRWHLKQAKCFECNCARCSDPTELRTFAGSILCKECKIGKIISTNPLNTDAAWKCQLCPHEITAKHMLHGNELIQKEIDALDKSTPSALEQLIHRYRDLLHETNTHVLQLKYALTQLYGSASDKSAASLKRRIELCKELLEVADILDGGSSIFRGNLLLDMQDATLALAQSEFATGNQTIEDYQESLQQCQQLLQEATEVMIYEPDAQEQLRDRETVLKNEWEMAIEKPLLNE